MPSKARIGFRRALVLQSSSFLIWVTSQDPKYKAPTGTTLECKGNKEAPPNKHSIGNYLGSDLRPDDQCYPCLTCGFHRGSMSRIAATLQDFSGCRIYGWTS